MRCLFVITFILFAPLSWAETVIVDESCNNKYAAKVVSLQGTFLVDPERKGTWHSARLNELICEGSGIKVAANSRASLRLGNDVVLRLHEGTNATLDAISTNQPTLIQLLKGFIHFISRTPRMMKINTPIANGGPEGTEFAMRVDDNKASLWVYEGGVKFYNDKGSVFLKPGEGGQTLKGQAPQAKIDIKPQDAVTWALYYPPALPYPDKNAVIDNELRTAINDYRQGHTDTALARLDSLPTTQQTPFFYQARAAMRLTLGQDQLALQDIQRLLINNPQDADALALHAILALTQNRKDEAYALATQAIAANPQAASAYSALSYAEQSRFQLDKAQAAANKATELAPHDAMVWARKAELLLSQGLTAESQQAAEKAIALDANLERTQTVLGFSYLLRMDTDAALETFNKAIEFDSTSPLARLGLGLAKIRKGDLEQGREDLETAAILDPNNSIVRSYLGKAYYEERRSPLAEDQFKLAKERDPKDPTPYFYDAINKQTTNRPVEALQDMQKAIELNGNRGVYRSKLLLDSDNAARSAAIGRIYRDVGFSQRALVESWKSISYDMSDYSGHRLLADSYANLSRHEISRVSELLQSQLLQPISIAPIQPSLAETNLSLLSGIGPTTNAYNEFNPLFTRDFLTLQTSGILGSNDTIGDETTITGIKNKTSYSLGQTYYHTDGFRDNNDSNLKLYNVFLQHEFSNNFNVQAEYRKRESDQGDLVLRFDPSKYSRINRRILNQDTARIGFHFSPSPTSDFIGSAIYTNRNSNVIKEGVTALSETEAYQFEAQHLFNDDWINIRTGGGFSRTNGNTNLSFDDGFKLPINPSQEYKNFYSYADLKFPKTVTWTFGLNLDFVDSLSRSVNKINPKIGFQWDINENIRLRSAFIQSTKRDLIVNQTIEPTTVAGFNQFFDDFNGSDTKRYGIGIDAKISKNLYAGFEFSERYLSVPTIVGETTVMSNRTERLARAYTYWTPNERWAVTTDLEYEKYKRDSIESSVRDDFEPISVETISVPLSLRYFDTSGFFSTLGGIFVHQEVAAFDPINTPNGSDTFFLVDAKVGYRLPKRRGIISVETKNLFDTHFFYQDRNVQTNGEESEYSSLIPERLFLFKATIAFD